MINEFREAMCSAVKQFDDAATWDDKQRCHIRSSQLAFEFYDLLKQPEHIAERRELVEYMVQTSRFPNEARKSTREEVQLIMGSLGFYNDKESN